MLTWIQGNLATIVVCIILITIAVLIIRKLIRDRKEGKCSCGGNCSGCSGCCSSLPKDDFKHKSH